jgi:hypothetical protein
MTHHDQDSSVAKNVLGLLPPKQYLNLAGTIANLVRMLQRTFPAGFVAPCLPTKTDKLPCGSQWLHEIKHDEFRIIRGVLGTQRRHRA